MAFAVRALVFSVAVLVPSPVDAQIPSCPGDGGSAVVVDVDSPRPGERVSGIVLVKGRASSAVPLSRMELRVGPSIVAAQTFPPVPSTEFVFNWDTRRTPPGSTVFVVVACGEGPGDELVRGASAVTVDLEEAGRGPLWVGAVIGISGLAGLAFSGAFRGRRRRVREGPVGASRTRRPPAAGAGQRGSGRGAGPRSAAR